MNVSGYARSYFCSCDLDLEPVTLIHKLDLDILKMYLRIENAVFRSRLSKVRAGTDRHTDRHDRTHYHAALAGGKNNVQKFTSM